MTIDSTLARCKCGGKARYRYHVPLHWVECRNKRCGQRTGYYPDIKGDFDTEAGYRAVAEWNKMMESI